MLPLATAKRLGRLACGARRFMPRTIGLDPFSPLLHPERVREIISKYISRRIECLHLPKSPDILPEKSDADDALLDS